MKSQIVFFSRTGNIGRFVKKLNYTNVTEITEGIIVKTPFVLITSTINFGQVPIEYKKFLKDNHKYMIGVSGSGNKNWGSNFAKAADTISQKYNVPIVTKFELSGNTHDVKTFIKEVERLEDEY